MIVVYALVVLMLLIWGGNYVAAKLVFRSIPPNIVVCVRTIMAAVFIIPVYMWEVRKRPLVKTWPELRLLILLGIGGVTVNQVFWTLGVARTTVVHSAMIMTTTPLWVLLIAGLLGSERITAFKAVGMAIAMSGVVLLQILRARGAAPAGQEATLLGDALVLGCALSMAALTAAAKVWKPLSGGIAISVVGYVGGAVLLGPLLPFASAGFDYTGIPAGAWLGLLYMSVMSSVVGYLIYCYALERMPASRLATFQYLQPVFASGLAVLILGERLGAGAVLAGAIILAGIFVAERFG